MPYPAPYAIDPQKGQLHTKTVILLHGRSSTAEDFANDVFSLKTSTPALNLASIFPSFRWVFPDAGERWCTPFKEKRSAWFDTFSLDDLTAREDLQVLGLRDGVHHVSDVIKEEVDRLGGNSNNLILGGFSQGSATALWSLFTGAALTKGSLGAFIGLSAWMPFTKEAKQALAIDSSIESRRPGAQSLTTSLLDIIGLEPFVPQGEMAELVSKMPVYLGHGTDDALISVTSCHELAAVFRALSADVEIQEYTGAERSGHWVKEPEQLDDIVRFLEACTGKNLV